MWSKFLSVLRWRLREALGAFWLLPEIAALTLIPLALLLTLMTSGCGGTAVAAKPVKPTLESLAPTPDGGLCMDRRDSRALLQYLIELERTE